MKSLLARYGPILLGILLGWLIVSPPEWLGESPLIRAAAALMLAAVALLGLTYAATVASLPADVEITPASAEELTGLQHR